MGYLISWTYLCLLFVTFSIILCIGTALTLRSWKTDKIQCHLEPRKTFCHVEFTHEIKWLILYIVHRRPYCILFPQTLVHRKALWLKNTSLTYSVYRPHTVYCMKSTRSMCHTLHNLSTHVLQNLMSKNWFRDFFCIRSHINCLYIFESECF